MFVVFTKINCQILSQYEIFQQLRKVTNCAVNRELSTITPIGAATVGNRNDAARFWLIMKEGNKLLIFTKCSSIILLVLLFSAS